MAVPPSQFIALQAINVLNETFSGHDKYFLPQVVNFNGVFPKWKENSLNWESDKSVKHGLGSI